MNRAIIDTSKGHADHGRLTVHTNPDVCPVVPTLTSVQSVGLATALNGVAAGQWAACAECEAVDESARRWVQES